MKNFEFAAAHSETEVLEYLSADAGETEILAGGTDLVGLMKKMIVTPDRVVNIMDVPSLKTIETYDDGGVSIGAAVTLDELLATPHLNDYAGIAHAVCGINSMQLQAQGTLGGELCQRARCWFFRNGEGLLAKAGRAVTEGDNRFHAIFGNSGPAKFVSGSRLAPVLIALNAQVRILGPTEQDEKLMPLAEFFHTPRHEGERETVLAKGQYVTHIVLPPAANRTSATYEVRHSEGPDYPTAAAAAALRIEAGVVRDANIVLGQVAPTPWVSQLAADALIGSYLDESLAEAAATASVSEATPLSNNEYKVQQAKVAVKRAILSAAGLETGGF